jgi:hypothetical protein
MTKIPRSSSDFSILDEHLETDGEREEFQAVAIKEALAWQIEQAMKAPKAVAQASRRAHGYKPLPSRAAPRSEGRQRHLDDAPTRRGHRRTQGALGARLRTTAIGAKSVTRVLIEFGDRSGETWSTVGVSGNIIDASF